MVLLSAYISVAPLVDYGREQLFYTMGRIDMGGPVQRLSLVNNFLQGARARGNDNPERWMLRLSYIPYQAFALQQYSNGIAGQTLVDVMIAGIPRIIWPDKPIISDQGSDFNYMLTGNRMSFASPGLFVEGYWNFGITGSVSVSLLYGLVLLIASRYARRVIRLGKIHYLPVVLFGVIIAGRPDDWFTTGLFGNVATAAMLHVVITLVVAASAVRRRVQPSSIRLGRIAVQIPIEPPCFCSLVGVQSCNVTHLSITRSSRTNIQARPPSLSLRWVVNGLEFGCAIRSLRDTPIGRVLTSWAVPGGSAVSLRRRPRLCGLDGGRLAGWSGSRASTSASQACGSTPLSLAVSIRV